MDSTVQSTKDGKNQEVTLGSKAKFTAGRESWKKGEDITFSLQSSDTFEADIGIIAVLNNGDYGKVYSKVVNVSSDDEIIKIQVPEDGDYGIYYRNNSSNNVIFKVNINKELKNPLF